MHWDSIIESLPWGIVVISLERKVVAFNSKAVGTIKCNPENLIGLGCAEIFGSAPCQSNCPLDASVRCHDSENTTGLFQLESINAECLLPEQRTIPWHDPEHNILGCIHIVATPAKSHTRPKIKEVKDLSEFGLLGASSLIHEVSYLIRSVAPTGSTVLLQGETGTGKEIAAKIIHSLSGRDKDPFVTLNCAALPENLIESELFGHEKGAFTGADKDSKGYFEIAHHGTIFLDEIAETSLFFQTKLLRVLQSGEYQRLGSAQQKKTGARIIAATNRDLVALIKAGQFREDLYYRINVFPIKMPPLRDRIADLPVLVNYFMKDFSPRMNKPVEGITEVALTLLFRYDFPGNVRELKNIIEYAFIKSNDRLIGPTDLPPRILESAPDNDLLKTDLSEQKILEVLAQFNHNIAKTARNLGISRKTLYQKLNKIKNRKEC